MSMGYMVKIAINQRLDHYTSGKEIYYDILDRVMQPKFDPFASWWEHKLISRQWYWKQHKIKHIAFIFIKKKHNMRYINRIISFKVKNCKVISKMDINPNLKFENSDIEYQKIVRIKLFE